MSEMLSSQPTGFSEASSSSSPEMAKVAIGAALAFGGATVGVPLVLGAVGFTAAGIAAGSLAANMMSAAAVANGGAVAAGSTVAVLQSIGAVGLSATTKTAIAGGVAALVALF